MWFVQISSFQNGEIGEVVAQRSFETQDEANEYLSDFDSDTIHSAGPYEREAPAWDWDEFERGWSAYGEPE